MRGLQTLLACNATMGEKAEELAVIHRSIEAAMCDLDMQARDMGTPKDEMPFSDMPELVKLIKQRQADYRKRKKEHTDG